MPLLNFKKQFAEKVETGKKRQTIRSMRKVPIKKGDRLYLYTGLRTKNCRKIGVVICVEVNHIFLDKKNSFIDGKSLNIDRLTDLAKLDGFDCLENFFDFFQNVHGLPFAGQLIHW